MTPVGVMHTGRLLVLAGILLCASAAARQLRVVDSVALLHPLRAFPAQIGSWHGETQPDLDPRVIDILGTDDYTSRIYRQATTSLPIDFYVGYYGSQRTGGLIHSPLNCLPGSGWQIVQSARTTIRLPAGTEGIREIDINRLVVQKADDRYVAFYWYQGRGRVTASEYDSRLFMAFDALRRHRTDGALIRVMSPIPDGRRDTGAPDAALRTFVQAAFPVLERYIPS